MQKNIFFTIGLMSGTSLDGVDLVYVKFDYLNDYHFEIIHSKMYPYSNYWKEKLQNAFEMNKDELNDLNIEYGEFLANLINDFIDKNSILKIDFIASHGHTIFHKPEEGYTLQIGQGQTIANITDQKVICDFRTEDIELKGQGAPLVPIGDRLLFKNYNYCLNLGGFANISFEEKGKRIAFDICPVNIVLNHYIRKIGLEYDDKGQMAQSGKINSKLLENLNQLQFYKINSPKSLGFEWVIKEIFPLLNSYSLTIEDTLRTFVEHVAIQISNQLKGENKSILITGGGAYNAFLISRITKLSKIKIKIPKKEIIEYKEALIFAFLGLLKQQNKINVLSSVTGAIRDHSSGKIFNPDRK